MPGYQVELFRRLPDFPLQPGLLRLELADLSLRGLGGLLGGLQSGFQLREPRPLRLCLAELCLEAGQLRRSGFQVADFRCITVCSVVNSFLAFSMPASSWAFCFSRAAICRKRRSRSSLAFFVSV